MLGGVLGAVADPLGLLQDRRRLAGDLGDRAGDVGLQVLQHRRLVGELRFQALDLSQALRDLLLGLQDRLEVDDRHLGLGGRRRRREQQGGRERDG